MENFFNYLFETTIDTKEGEEANEGYKKKMYILYDKQQPYCIHFTLPHYHCQVSNITKMK